MVDPNQALQQLLQPGGVQSSLFPATSRYHDIATATLETAEGKQVIYLTRRLVPQPDRFALLQEHVVTQGERLDNITAQYLDDPTQFWRLCDANGALHPQELEEVGRRLRITLPEGLSGLAHG